MTVYVGVDPDTHQPGIAVLVDVAPGIKRWALHTYAAKGRLAEDRISELAGVLVEGARPFLADPHSAVEIAVEYQHIRPRDPRPNDIMGLQFVGGMLFVAMKTAFPQAKLYTPIPSAWKGTVPKAVMHERILQEARESWDSPLFKTVPKSARSECTDAMGLALWLRRGRRLR